MMRITKTDYIEYTLCAKNLWLRKHDPELFKDHELTEFEQEIIRNGEIVDEASMNLFPDGKLVDSRDPDSLDLSKELVADNTGTIFQPSFEWNNFFARPDILHFNDETKGWELYEVKATTSVKTSPYNHIKDLVFQTIVLKANNIDISHIGVIHLNKDYRRNGEIDFHDLFEKTDVTNAVLAAENTVDAEMNELQAYLDLPEKPGCECLYKGRSAHCPTFSYSNPDIPDYSVHDISRIGNSKKKLTDWINRDIYSIQDIDNPEKLTDYQRLQYDAHMSGQMIVDHKEIKDALASLDFPLHFLDYETSSTAIPEFNKFGPWQQIPFQYSLHILNRDGSLEHKEYLIQEPVEDITLTLVRKMAEHFHPKGAVVVWNASFERTRNTELAVIHPDYSEFLDNINNRIFDLRKVFSNGYYVDGKFHGKTGLKDVLPILVPELSYSELGIQTGQEAPVSWRKITHNRFQPSEKKVVVENLLEYCKMDTLAMVRIYELLNNL